MRTMKTLASLALATAITVPTALAAEPAAAHPVRFHTWVDTNTTRMDFQRHRTDTYSIKTKAMHRSGKGINGKAILRINGDQKRWHRLKHGNSLFRIDRSDLRRGKSRIVVLIKPSDPRQVGKAITRFVVDKPQRNEGKRVVRVAKRQVGDRYVFGASGPRAFDCSGLVKYSYRHATGERLPHSSTAIRREGKRVSHPKPGDVVWTPGHVSVYAGHGKVVEAARPGTRVRVVRQWQRNAVYLRF